VTYLLDTNVLSELRKRVPDEGVEAWYTSVASSELFLSVLTIGEVRLGVERLRRKDPPAAERLERWLDGLVVTYGDRIVVVDSAVAQQWGRISVPDPVPVIDGLLAATVLVRGWTLVTRNTSQVERTGARLLNPFSAR
jgi:hypothetical protein